MTSGQSRQAVKSREYTWPGPRPPLHLLLTGKFHSHWVLGCFFFNLQKFQGLQWCPVSSCTTRPVTLAAPGKWSFISWGLLYKEKTRARFECSTWLSATTARQKKGKLATISEYEYFWEPLMRKQHNQHCTHLSLRWLQHQEVKSAIDKCTLHLTKTYQHEIKTFPVIQTEEDLSICTVSKWGLMY